MRIIVMKVKYIIIVLNLDLPREEVKNPNYMPIFLLSSGIKFVK